MAATKGILGNYATFMNVAITEAVAGTLIQEKIESGMSMYDRVGWVLNRIEWMVPIATLNLLLDQNDAISFGIATSGTLGSLSDTDPNIINRNRIGVSDFGTPANAVKEEMPIINDFSTMPGGGILVLPNPLYVFLQSVSIASAATVNMRAWFISVNLNEDDYFLLAQARMLLNQ